MQSFVKGRQVLKDQHDRSQLAELARLPTGDPFAIPALPKTRNTSRQPFDRSLVTSHAPALDHEDLPCSESESTGSNHIAPKPQLISAQAGLVFSGGEADEGFKRPAKAPLNLQTSRQTVDDAHKNQAAQGQIELGVESRKLRPSQSVQSYPTTTSGIDTNPRALTHVNASPRSNEQEVNQIERAQASRGPLGPPSRSRIDGDLFDRAREELLSNPERDTEDEIPPSITGTSSPARHDANLQAEPPFHGGNLQEAHDGAASTEPLSMLPDYPRLLTDTTGNDIPIRSS